MSDLEAPLTSRRAELDGSLRTRAAGGVLVNAGFALVLQGVTVLRGLVVAAFVAPSQFGAWGVIVVSYIALSSLLDVGVVDRYIQQDEPDQCLAFRLAFTLQAMLTAAASVVFAALVPLFAVLFDAPSIVIPALVTLLAVPGQILQLPLWTLQRSMTFRRQRQQAAVDPLVAAVVTVLAAMLGAGLWAFVLGTIAGAWAGALVILPRAVYSPRLRFERDTARDYVRFAGPLLLANVSTAALIWTSTLVASAATGLAGVGALALANPIRLYAEAADRIVSGAMYPAVCAVRNRADLLWESFVKSNRLALMWGVPIGVGAALFTDDLIRFVVGAQWAYAADLLRTVGLASAVGHVAFNWDDYVRAAGDTRPIARYAWLTLLGWSAGPILLLVLDGLRGYGIGVLAMAVVSVGLRGFFLRRQFPGRPILRHGWRAVVPTIPAVAAVLIVRALSDGSRTLPGALSELVLYGAVTVVATWLAERALLREAYGYLRRR